MGSRDILFDIPNLFLYTIENYFEAHYDAVLKY